MIKHIVRLPLLALCLAVALAPLGLQASNDDGLEPPEHVVKRVFDESVDALLDNKDEIRESPRAAYELIQEIFAPLVHYELMGQLILTRHWREATPEQREAFIEAFSEYLVRTYAGLLSDNVDAVASEVNRSGRILEIQSTTEPDQRGRVVVRTLLHVQDSPVPVQYRMIATDDGWRVWDVVIENISFVTNYRDEYGSEIRRNGLDSLIQRLQERNARAWSRS